MSKSVEYIENLLRIQKEILAWELPNIQAAAEAVAKALETGHKVFAFGTGHSHMLAEEMFYRAGGLVKIVPILEEELMLHKSASDSTVTERRENYGRELYKKWNIRPGDVLFVFSNSGRNAVSVDMALEARENGVPVIALTNLNHAKSSSSRHPSGKSLHDIADIVLDNHGCVGDASIYIEKLGRNVAPTSTSAGAMILNAIESEAVDILCEKNIVPEVFASSNVDKGDEINNTFLEKYKGVLPCL